MSDDSQTRVDPQACCAHVRVVNRRHGPRPGYITREWWECDVCGTEFRAVHRGDGTPGPAREAALTEAEVEAVSWFFQYGATRGNHSDEGRGPSPGPLTPHIDAMASAMRKIRALASGDSGEPSEALKAEAWNAAWDEAAWPPDGVPHPDRLVRFINIYNRGLRAELGRAPNGWEEAANVCDEYANFLASRPDKWEPEQEPNILRAAGVKELALRFRARADAERREPAP